MANARLAVFDSLNADDVFIAVPLVGLKLGALTRTRTADLLLTKQLLYQLSYKGILDILYSRTLTYVNYSSVQFLVWSNDFSCTVFCLKNLRGFPHIAHLLSPHVVA